jgi:hypothetical protein
LAIITPSPMVTSSEALMREPGLMSTQRPMRIVPAPASRPQTPISTRCMGSATAVKQSPIWMFGPEIIT